MADLATASGFAAFDRLLDGVGSAQRTRDAVMERLDFHGRSIGNDRSVSAGRACRLLQTADSWIALSLPRESDVELVPALLSVPPLSATADPWAAVAERVRHHTSADLSERAALLGLALGVVGETASPGERPWRTDHVAEPKPQPAELARTRLTQTRLTPPVAVELASLWAGPLCGRILSQAGFDVIKVESASRPDGARRDPSGFFEAMNACKTRVSLDFATEAGRDELARLVGSANVVIEGSRPRALRALGLDADVFIREPGPRAWLSITGHGRTGRAAARVGFGDDAAAAGGLVDWVGDSPRFVADAIADPLAGLGAACAALELISSDTSGIVDQSLAGAAAWFKSQSSDRG